MRATSTRESSIILPTQINMTTGSIRDKGCTMILRSNSRHNSSSWPMIIQLKTNIKKKERLILKKMPLHLRLSITTVLGIIHLSTIIIIKYRSNSSNSNNRQVKVSKSIIKSQLWWSISTKRTVVMVHKAVWLMVVADLVALTAALISRDSVRSRRHREMLFLLKVRSMAKRKDVNIRILSIRPRTQTS